MERLPGRIGIAAPVYSAECWTTTTNDPTASEQTYPPTCEMATLTAEKPNLMRYDSWAMSAHSSGVLSKKEETPRFTFVCDGKKNWRQFGKMYRTNDRTDPETLTTILEPWEGFYDAGASLYAYLEYVRQHGKIIEIRSDGTESVEGTPCAKVFIHWQITYEDTVQDSKMTWYLGRHGLVRRRVEHVQIGERGYSRDDVLRNIKTNFAVANPHEIFAYTPPKGVESEAQGVYEQPKLLANGTTAPDFTAVAADGMPVKLSELRGKVVVVDFWESWCGPCKASMPHTQEVAKKLQTANVPLIVLTVDKSEDQPAFAAWVKSHPELDALRFCYVAPKKDEVSAKLFDVSGIPAQYVIDPEGVIQESFVGYGGPTDDLEKAIRAAATVAAK